jgi:hypothetical protein
MRKRHPGPASEYRYEHYDPFGGAPALADVQDWMLGNEQAPHVRNPGCNPRGRG